MSYQAVIRAMGAYLPQQVLTNQELAARVDTSDDWIRSRTGIEQRHIAAEGEATSDLAANAARNALERAGLTAENAAIDLILVATSTPDYTMPSTATLVQQKLGITTGFAFDLAAACSGFVYGLGVVQSMIASGQIKRALLIGAETMSRIIDWEDRTTCVLFGDGAGAALIEAEADSDRGILASTLYADGMYSSILGTTGGTSTTQTAGFLQMEGQDVFRQAVDKMAGSATELLQKCNLTIDDINHFVPHQANKRIMDAIARKLGVAPEKFLITLNKHANTSAASIPLALHDGVTSGRIQPGHFVATPALGAGLTWGGCIIKW